MASVDEFSSEPEDNLEIEESDSDPGVKESSIAADSESESPGEVSVEDVDSEETELGCIDTNTFDLNGENCDWYTPNRLRFCGTFDDEDFTASSMCCACIDHRSSTSSESSQENCKPQGSVDWGT